MANSGYFENKFRTGYALRVEWKIISQSIENNTSTVTFKVFLVSEGRIYYINSTLEKQVRLFIDGTVYTKTEAGLSKLKGGQKKELFSKTLIIEHNFDGTREVELWCEYDLEVTLSGKYWGTIRIPDNGEFGSTVTATFTDIPRPTIPILEDNVVMNSNVKISLPRTSELFTHNLKIVFGNQTQTIAEGVETECAWIPETATFAPEIPNAESGAGSLICETYKSGEYLGAKTITVVLVVPDDVIPVFNSPKVEAVETVEGIFEKFGTFIQGNSKPKFTIHASGVYGSTVATYKTTFDGLTYNEKTFECEKVLNAGMLELVTTVTDSRGRSATYTENVEVLPYTMPTITKMSGFRCDANGNESSDDARIFLDFGFAITPLNNLNDKLCILSYKEAGSETWQNLTSWNENYVSEQTHVTSAVFNPDNAYSVKLTVKDFFTTDEKILSLATGFTLIDFNASGKALAFGKVSQIDNAMEIALPAKFLKGVLHSVLTAGTDFDSLTASNTFVLTSDNEYLNSPVANVDATIEIINGEDGIIIQRVSIASDTDPETHERVYGYEGWGEWVNVNKCIVADVETKISEIENTFSTFRNEFLSMVYPVGSIYISADSTNPKTLFGGTWTQIKDSFLLACGTKYSDGDTGGAESYDLNLTHNHVSPIAYNSDSVGGVNINGTISGGAGKEYKTATIAHSGTLPASTNVNLYNTSDATVSETVPTMPPYLAVFVWQRTK